jgi:hypothetical protein
VQTAEADFMAGLQAGAQGFPGIQLVVTQIPGISETQPQQASLPLGGFHANGLTASAAERTGPAANGAGF